MQKQVVEQRKYVKRREAKGARRWAGYCKLSSSSVISDGCESAGTASRTVQGVGPGFSTLGIPPAFRTSFRTSRTTTPLLNTMWPCV